MARSQYLAAGIRARASLRGPVHLCDSREVAENLLREVPPAQLFPDKYTVEAPIAHYNWRLTFAAIAEGKNLQTLRARGEARRIVRTWLSEVAKGRRVVTVTLRETPYEQVRNSQLEQFGGFVRKLDKTRILPVILRDQAKALEPLPPEFDGAARFDPAIWNLELRMAMYEYADYNLLINNGPYLMATFSENVHYGVIRPDHGRCGDHLARVDKGCWMDAGCGFPAGWSCYRNSTGGTKKLSSCSMNALACWRCWKT